MAEERISIHHCSNKCRYLREISCDILIEDGMSNGTYCSAYIHGPWQKIDPEKDCKNCKRAEYNGMSRTEAIERMTRAMFAVDIPVGGYKVLAEAALDALLKD